MNGSSPITLSFAASSGMEGQVGEMNCSSDQLPYSFLNLNLETSMDQSLPFESALSSIVSSPGASNAAIPTGGVAIRELIGKLGGLCNSGEISPELQTFGGSGVAYMCGNNSAEPSCYSTPINSPPKLNLSIMDHHVRGSLPMVNSMPTHPSLAPFPADPGFAERAARHACVGIRGFNGLMNPFGSNDAEFPYQTMPIMENGRLSRVSSSQSLKAGGQFGNMVNKDAMLQDRLDTTSASDRKFSRSSRPSTPDNVELTSPRDDSSASEQIPGGEARHDVNARKRKAATRGKVKELPSSPVTKDAKVAAEDEDPSTKRCKQAKSKGNDEDCAKGKEEPNGSTSTAGDGNQKETKDNPKPPEPPKDYIHVRARRGQATDSHSLAERVRREKISERMKFLQDLVPGCNKVTGKALMLDEIINYVQSLQRQVEFLSMKLASLNPKMDSNMEALFSKEILQPRGSSLSHAVFSSDPSASAFSYAPQPQQQPPLHGGITNGLDTQCSLNPMDAALCRNISMKLHPLDGFSDVSSQALAFWEDDLQSFIQMGFGQNQEPLRSSSFHGSLPTSHMKIDL